MHHTTEAHTFPFVSVVIPAHNESDFIADCIDSVLANDWPRDRLEILVVDHSSTDSTAEIARAAGANVISVKAGRIGAVRNAGLHAAKGEFIAYVDGDCTVPPTWLRTAVEILETDKSIGAVGGPCLAPANGTWIERGLAPSTCRPGIIRPAIAVATSSLIAGTTLLRNLGGFNEALISGEDDDLSNRIRASGLELMSASDCHIVHRGYPRTWGDLVQKEWWHGSNHLDVQSEFDLTLLLSVEFLLASLALAILLPWLLISGDRALKGGVLVAFVAQAIPPILYGWKRFSQSLEGIRLLPSFVGVGYAYFAGHSLGVAANYLRRYRLIPLSR